MQECQQLQLSTNDQEVFMRVLLNPPRPSKKLLAAAKKYKINNEKKLST